METGRVAVVDRAAGSMPAFVVGLDLAGTPAQMALHGVSSIISARADRLARWTAGGSSPRLLLAPGALEALGRRESGPGCAITAVAAVPGWFGALDRAAVRALLGTEAQVVRVVSSASAAVMAWLDRQRVARSDQVVLCVDVGHGVSGVVVAARDGSLREVVSAALEPSVGAAPGGEVRPELLTALVGHLLQRARAAGVDLVDVALLAAGGTTRAISEQWGRTVAAATRPGDVAPMPSLVDRTELVAGGAALVAGTVADGPSPLSTALAHRLGVLVDDGSQVRVMTLLEAGQPLPALVDQLFAADASVPVRLELVEARRPGAGDDPADWSQVAGATWVERPTAVSGSSSSTEVVLELSVDVDGAVSIGPSRSWTVLVGVGAVEWSADPVSETPEADPGERPTSAAPMLRASIPAVEPIPPESAAVASSSATSGRSLAWPSHEPLPHWPPPSSASGDSGPSTSDSTRSTAPGPASSTAEASTAAADAAAAIVHSLREALRPAPSIGLDPVALEEIACAEVGAPSLATALGELERQLSKRFGLLIGVRSAPALLDCDDDADLPTLRAHALRLDAALEGQPDDELTEAARAAVRAARRAFADPSRGLFVGGSAAAIRADAARVAEHLRLVVGDLVTAERQRIAVDARLRGLSLASTERVLAEVVGGSQPAVPTDGQVAPTMRDAAARVGLGHRGWSLEAHADPYEPVCTEERPEVAQIRVLLLERCLGVL